MAYPLPSTVFNNDDEERNEQSAPSVQGEPSTLKENLAGRSKEHLPIKEIQGSSSPPGRTVAGRDPSKEIQGSTPSALGGHHPLALQLAHFLESIPVPVDYKLPSSTRMAGSIHLRRL